MLELVLGAVAVLEFMAILYLVGKGRRRFLFKPGRRWLLVLAHVGRRSRMFIYELEREDTPFGLRTKTGYYVKGLSGEFITGKYDVYDLDEGDYLETYDIEPFGEVIVAETKRMPIIDKEKKYLLLDPYPRPILRALKTIESKSIVDGIISFAWRKATSMLQELNALAESFLKELEDRVTEMKTLIRLKYVSEADQKSKELRKEAIALKKKLYATHLHEAESTEGLRAMEQALRKKIIEEAKLLGLTDEEIETMKEMKSIKEMIDFLERRKGRKVM